jgi:ribosome-binding factor A
LQNRKKRVGNLIKSEVSEMILKELKDPRIGFVSVTDVEVSGDLRYATVYFTVLGEEKDVEATVAALQHATGYVRREIATRLRLRYAPEIRFKYDEAYQRAWHLEEILRNLHESEDNQAHEDQGGTSNPGKTS